MNDHVTLARGWLSKGASDLMAARAILSTDGPYDTACFHTQQSIEKTLKALLAFHRQAIPRTHDLEELARLCQHREPTLTLTLDELAQASDYAVQVRYDMDIWPTQEEATECLALADQVLSAVLGLLPPEAHP